MGASLRGLSRTDRDEISVTCSREMPVSGRARGYIVPLDPGTADDLRRWQDQLKSTFLGIIPAELSDRLMAEVRRLAPELPADARPLMAMATDPGNLIDCVRSLPRGLIVCVASAEFETTDDGSAIVDLRRALTHRPQPE